MLSGRWRNLVVLAVFWCAAAGCSPAPSPAPEPSPGNSTGGKAGGSGPSATGGGQGSGSGGAPSGTGGSSSTGTGGASSSDTGGAGTGGSSNGGSGGAAGSAPADAGSTPADSLPPVAPSDGGGSLTSPPFDINAFGAVGETPYVPMQYTDTPVGPPVAMECPDDPTAGHSEYKGFFKVQRPSNLKAGDRFGYKDGIYTFFVNSNDNSHSPGNGTAPRTEARYPSYASGEHIWSADMMYEHVDKTCVFQIHNEVGNYATYLRITGDMMFDLKTRKTVTTGMANKWFNMKVLFNTENLDVKIYINNCLKFTAKSPKGPTPNWYFKHGTYTCESGTCKSHYKNIHLYQLGSKDPLGMPPPPGVP
jgi:hypothetical protein